MIGLRTDRRELTVYNNYLESNINTKQYYPHFFYILQPWLQKGHGFQFWFVIFSSICYLSRSTGLTYVKSTPDVDNIM